MNNNLIDSYDVTIEPISPIHIGTGNDIPPYEYVIKEDTLYRINFLEIFDNLDEKSRMILSEKFGDLNRTGEWLNKYYKPEWGYIYKSEVSTDFSNLHSRNIVGNFNSDDKNQLLVKECIKNYDKPYLPGTSIKGALRTAYIMLDENIRYDLERDKTKKTYPIRLTMDKEFKPHIKNEKKRLKIFTEQITNKILSYNGDAKEDPFKSVKVGDFISDNITMKVNKSGRFGKKKGTPSQEEMILGSYGTNVENIFKGRINFFEGYYAEGKINKNITKDDILKGLNRFAAKEIKKDMEVFRKLDQKANFKNLIKFYEYLDKVFKSLDEDCAFIRLGKNTGFASKTLVHNNKGRSEHAVTKIIVDNSVTMGWALIKFKKSI